MTKMDDDREEVLRRIAAQLTDAVRDKLQAVRPKPETIAFVRQQLEVLPVRLLRDEEQADVARFLNLLRALSSGDVVSLIVTMEYRADAGHCCEVLAQILGDPRRLSCLKVIHDDLFYEALGDVLTKLASGPNPPKET